MINVGNIVLDKAFAQSFTISRSSGSWVAGDFIENKTEIPLNGTIIPMSAKELQMLPEGERNSEWINIYTTEELYTTRLENEAAGTGALSDEVIWNGQAYRIKSVKNYSAFGYYKSEAQKLTGA